MAASPENLLIPSFENAFWRAEERRRFRDFPGFAKARGHSEPAEISPAAERWAHELAREESAEEIRRVYENATVILGLRRSQMERTDTTLETPAFRYQIHATQDPEASSRVLLTRELRIELALSELPEAFDDLFPFRADELVIPVNGSFERRAVLLVLEDWEHALRGRLSESADQHVYRLRLTSGFALRVDLARRETVFEQEGASGVLALGQAITRGLKEFGIRRRLR